MIRIFEFTDEDGDGMSVEETDSGVWFTMRTNDGSAKSVLLTGDAAGKLRSALSPYDEAAITEMSNQWQLGYDAAIQGLESELTRAFDDGVMYAENELRSLDPQRVAALEKAAELAERLRSTGFASASAVAPETVVGYALFLLDELPVPAVAK